MVKNWIKKNISHFIGKKNWDIYLSSIGKYRLVQITDPPFRLADLSSTYITLLDFFLTGCELIMLSQYVDESQGMFEHREQVLPEITDIYGLQVRITNNYSSLNEHASNAKEYVLNVFGKPGIEWLRKVLAYGGTDLSNILYGLGNSVSNWTETIVDMNRLFTKWYWLETSDSDLILLRDQVKILCWTSDLHLNVLLEGSELNKILSYIQEVAMQNEMELNIVNKR